MKYRKFLSIKSHSVCVWLCVSVCVCVYFTVKVGVHQWSTLNPYFMSLANVNIERTEFLFTNRLQRVIRNKIIHRSVTHWFLSELCTLFIQNYWIFQVVDEVTWKILTCRFFNCKTLWPLRCDRRQWYWNSTNK